MTARWVPAEPGAQVIGLRWGYSPEKYQYEEFDSPEEAWEYAGHDSFVEIVSVRNPGGGVFTFEGRFLPDPSARLHNGATVQRVWYSVPGSDAAYEDFQEARRNLPDGPARRPYVLEHLRFQDTDGHTFDQDGRILNLDSSWSPVSRRYADATRAVR